MRALHLCLPHNLCVWNMILTAFSNKVEMIKSLHDVGIRARSHKHIRVLSVPQPRFSAWCHALFHFAPRHLHGIKINLRSFKSSEHINEKGDGPYRGF